MGATKILPIPQDFAVWYSKVAIVDIDEICQKRWAGISKYVLNASEKSIEFLLKLAFKTRQSPSDEEVMDFRKYFKESDATFELEGNDKELQILAAITLVGLMEYSEELGSATALAITTAYFGGARKPELPMDLLKISEACIVKRSEESRNRPNLSGLAAISVQKLDLEQAGAKAAAQFNAQGITEAFKLAGQEVRTAIVGIGKQYSLAIQAAEHFISIQDEELQMLWWLIGGRSTEFDKNFADISDNLRPIILSRELANYTSDAPGPVSIKALLGRAGIQASPKIKISTVINEIDSTLAKSMTIFENISPVTTPIHFAILRQNETGQGASWIAGWASAVGVAQSYALSPLELAVLFYREQLILNSF